MHDWEKKEEEISKLFIEMVEGFSYAEIVAILNRLKARIRTTPIWKQKNS